MKILLFLLLLPCFLTITAQETKMGPILTQYGPVFQIDNPDLLLDIDKVYRVIFDVYIDPSKDGKQNPLLTTVARYLNMHAQQGVPKENMKIVVVLHGAATKSTLNSESYQKQFMTKNPNQELIAALKNVDVTLYVCGQSYLAQGFDIKNKSKNVKLALSALTALVKFQSLGYQLITFN